MQDSLLWVYEGQTQFWGYVLGARSGMLSKQDTLDAIAATAGDLQHRHARPRMAAAGRHDQRSDHRQRGAAAVAQLAAVRGLLQRGPADLARRRPHHPPAVRRQALDRRFRKGVLRHSRPRLGRGHLYVRRRRRDAEPGAALRLARIPPAPRLRRSPQAPLEGINAGRLPTGLHRRADQMVEERGEERKNTDLTYSGGFVVGSDGKVTSVLWDSPAFNAGLTVGDQIVAVNGRSVRCRRAEGTRSRRAAGQRPRRRAAGQERRPLPQRQSRLARRPALSTAGEGRQGPGHARRSAGAALNETNGGARCDSC